MRIIILGGTKYVGLELLSLLNKYDVYILSRKKIALNNITSIVIDRKDNTDLKNKIEKIEPDVIIDMICYDEDDAKNIINIISPLSNLKHYIMISTFFIYNYSLKYEEFENIKIENIKDNYTKNKYLAEKQIVKSNIYPKASIVRFPFIFSMDDYSKRFEYIVNQTMNKKEVIVDDMRCSFILKIDGAKSLYSLIHNSPVGIIDIANKQCISLKEIYDISSKIYNKQLKYIENNRDVYQIKNNICLDSKKVLNLNLNLQSIYDAFENEFIKYKLKDMI